MDTNIKLLKCSLPLKLREAASSLEEATRVVSTVVTFDRIRNATEIAIEIRKSHSL
jgi:hypothetical protein